MADVSIPEEEPTMGAKIGSRVAELIADGHALYAEAVTGDAQGRTRRPTLFVVAVAAVAIGFVVQLALVVALIAITALALTDQVVEL